MSTEREARIPTGPLRKLLLLMFMLACLFVMHGLQASADPIQHPGVAIAAAVPGMESVHAGAGTSPHAYRWPSDGSPHRGHAAGQMCLGLLSMMTALLILAGILGRLPGPPARGATAPRGLGRQDRSPSPPSIFELSVLRT